MTDLEVRIVRLEPMRIASAYGFGESPEPIAHRKMLDFVKVNGLLRPDNTYTGYGFNNPNPSHGSPNYGYEIWVPVDPDVQGTDDIEIKEFAGGLYAVTRFTGISQIGDVWRRLVAWREDSPYRQAHHQWLEHLLNPLEPDPGAYIFDLYLPVQE